MKVGNKTRFPLTKTTFEAVVFVFCFWHSGVRRFFPVHPTYLHKVTNDYVLFLGSFIFDIFCKQLDANISTAAHSENGQPCRIEVFCPD
jgi:hypothetical protein